MLYCSRCFLAFIALVIAIELFRLEEVIHALRDRLESTYVDWQTQVEVWVVRARHVFTLLAGDAGDQLSAE